jgi:type IV pilus assembly protein PilC
MTTVSKNLMTFTWMGISTQGKKLFGEIQAPNKSSAKLQLKNQNILFLKLHKKNVHRFTFNDNRISDVVILFFFRQLATLMTAGVPIIQSLTILNQSHNHFAFQTILTSIKTDLEVGKSFAMSLRQYPRYFDNLTCQLIQIGEQTGTLTRILSRIAIHKENILSLKKKTIQSLFYPAIVLIIAVLVSFIMLTFVVPRFAELFQSMQGKLPTLTVYIIYLSHFIRYYGWLAFIPFFASIIVFKQINHLYNLRKKFDVFMLKIPLINHILSKTILARFARSLSIAVGSGMSITESLKITAEIANNHFYAEAIYYLQAEIEKGQPLYKSMQKNTAFPAMMIQMLKIGEETGMLEQMLEKLADIYEADIDHLITNLAHILEPLIMIILGVLIGVLVIAMYMPIFKLGTLM